MKLDVTVQELDYIFQVLNTRPHGEVRPLFDKLFAQANSKENQNGTPTDGISATPSEGAAG